MKPRSSRLHRQQRTDAGAVLPIALFGMLVISLLVACALLTASSELVLSRAYQEGLRSLHNADAALEKFVAGGSVLGAVEGHTLRGASTSADGERFDISLLPLREGEVEVDTAGTFTRRDLFSLVAEPANGRGRVSGALIETVRVSAGFRLRIDAAATVAGDAVIGAGALLSAGGNDTCSRLVSAAPIRLGAGRGLSGSGVQSISGTVLQDSLNGGPVVEQALSGNTLWDLTQGAEHQFGAAFAETPFDTFYGPRHNAVRSDYRWGCPVNLVFTCPAEAAAETPVTVVDAAGSEVNLEGGHGQGVLIIAGGGARLGGDFRFSGLVLVEGSLRIEGMAQIMGGAVVGGDLSLGSGGADSAEAPALVFDGCSLALAERALSIARLNAAPQTLDSPTFGWYEVVR